MNKFRTFTERIFKRTDWPWKYRDHFYHDYVNQIEKHVLCHTSAKLRSAQVNIAPLPMSSEERKSF